MQKVVHDLVASLDQSPAISQAKKPPIVMVTNLQNKTDEHIDTQSIMDMVSVELQRGGRVAFVDKEAREDVAKEYEYQNSGMVNAETKKVRVVKLVPTTSSTADSIQSCKKPVKQKLFTIK